MSEFELKGRHVAAAFVGGFAIIIGVNLLLAFSAVRTFPGLEVKNSYVASQSFDADRIAQNALQWSVSAEIESGVVTLRIDDDTGPVAPQITQATLGRATHVQDDRELEFEFDGAMHVADASGLEPGNWNLRLVAKADNGTEFRQRIVLRLAK